MRGFCKVRFASGIEIADMHQAGSRIWAAPPGKPMLDRDGAVLRGEDGKVRYAACQHGFKDASNDPDLVGCSATT